MLPDAPPDLVPVVQILTHGDRCDKRQCGARAYVRVCVYRAGTTETAGLLHWCAHHFREYADRFMELERHGRCAILNEIRYLE